MRRLRVAHLLRAMTLVAVALVVWHWLPDGDRSPRWWIRYTAETVAGLVVLFAPTGVAAFFAVNRREPLRGVVYFFVAVLLVSTILTAWLDAFYGGVVRLSGQKAPWDYQFHEAWPRVLVANALFTLAPLGVSFLVSGIFTTRGESAGGERPE